MLCMQLKGSEAVYIGTSCASMSPERDLTNLILDPINARIIYTVERQKNQNLGSLQYD